MIIFQNNKKFLEFKYSLEDELEKEIISNQKLFFGESTIYIDAKRKIEAKVLGGAIPDGFLFDLSDKNNPEFYIIEIELSRHDFYNHIFPQITKFFSFFKNPKSQAHLIEKIYSLINADLELKKEFKKYLGEKEVYKFVKDVIEDSQNILLFLDEEKEELPEIIDTYTDTWGKIVKLLILKKFVNNDKEIIYFLNPEFENIEYSEGAIGRSEKVNGVQYSEEYHLEDVSTGVKEIYQKIKSELLLNFNNDLIFNPTKYYISIVHNRSIAYLKLRKNKIRMTIMLAPEALEKTIKHHTFHRISESVQKYWGGPSCDVIIENTKHLDEIINVLGSLLK